VARSYRGRSELSGFEIPRTTRADLLATAEAQQKRKAEADAQFLRDELSGFDKEIASKQPRAEEIRQRLPPSQ
jgi:hypothetical protein